MPGERWQNMLRDRIKLQVERTTIEPTEAELSLLSLVASGFDPLSFELQDAQVQRQTRTQTLEEWLASAGRSVDVQSFTEFALGRGASVIATVEGKNCVYAWTQAELEWRRGCTHEDRLEITEVFFL